MVAPITPQNVQSPQSVTRKRRLAEAMMQQGSDTSPVGHPLGALARALQGGMAGYMSHKADTAEKEGLASVMAKMQSGDNAGVMMDQWATPGMSQLAQIQYERDNPTPPPPTDDMREADRARVDPYFAQYMQGRSPQTNVTVDNSGEQIPFQDAELMKKMGGAEGELWGKYAETGANMGDVVQQLEVMDELAKTAPQGPITGRLAQAFPGFSTAGDAFTSIATRMAPKFRVPGSGAQSDREYEGFLNSLPRLQNQPGANQIISQVLRAKAQIDLGRADIVAAVQNGEMTPARGRKQLAELNRQSILSPELQAIIEQNAGAPPAEGTPDAEGWVTRPNGVRVRLKAP